MRKNAQGCRSYNTCSRSGSAYPAAARAGTLPWRLRPSALLWPLLPLVPLLLWRQPLAPVQELAFRDSCHRPHPEEQATIGLLALSFDPGNLVAFS